MNRLLRAVPVLLFVAMAGCSAAPAAMAPAPTATPPVAAPALSGATPASPLPPPTSLSSTDVPAPAPAALANPAGQTVRVYNPSGVRADGVFIDEGLKKNMADVKNSVRRWPGNFRRSRSRRSPSKAMLSWKSRTSFTGVAGRTACPSCHRLKRVSSRC